MLFLQHCHLGISAGGNLLRCRQYFAPGALARPGPCTEIVPPVGYKMAARSALGTRGSTAAEAPGAKRSRRSEAPSGVDDTSEQGAERCRFSSPIPVEPGAPAAQCPEESASGPTPGTEVEVGCGTAKHLSGNVHAHTNQPCWHSCGQPVLRTCLSHVLTTAPPISQLTLVCLPVW